jgi:hypothetical protein
MSERLLVGLATVFDRPSADRVKTRWPASAFQRFTDLSPAIPVKLDHKAIVTAYSNGQIITSIGRTLDYAILPDSGSTPAGLLTLARLDAGDLGDGLLAQVRRGLGPWTGGHRWGFSVHAAILDGDHSNVREAWPTELSLTTKPAFEDALVLASGADALRVWELLTGRPHNGSHSPQAPTEGGSA